VFSKASPVQVRVGVVLAGATWFLWWLIGHRIELVLDEGIYLTGAVRILRGSLPYRDFFALTGPGVFWNVALMFELFGIKLSSAHILLVADLALLTACLYWLTCKLCSNGTALWLSGVFLGLLILYPGNLTVNHRWDSSAFAVLAVCCFYHALAGGRSVLFFCAGLASAYAAWITPPALAFLVIMLLWLVGRRLVRATFLVAAGTFCVSAPILTVLFVTKSLFPMARHLGWSAANYPAPNHVFYGGLFAGYGGLFKGIHGGQLLWMTVFVVLISLPASAPVIAAAGFGSVRRNMPAGSSFLLLAVIAGCLVSYPRMDIAHLEFATPLSYAVATAVVSRLLPRRVGGYLAGFLTVGTAVFGLSVVEQRAQLDGMQSRVGTLVGDRRQIAFVESLERAVQPGDNCFSFPYMPLAYFITLAEAPTRYLYLQPGLMTDEDEAMAMADLRRHPPDKVLYSSMDAKQLLRLFPSTPRNRLKFPVIESWLAKCYEVDRTRRIHKDGVDLLIPSAGAGCSASAY